MAIYADATFDHTQVPAGQSGVGAVVIIRISSTDIGTELGAASKKLDLRFSPFTTADRMNWDYDEAPTYSGGVWSAVLKVLIVGTTQLSDSVDVVIRIIVDAAGADYATGLPSVYSAGAMAFSAAYDCNQTPTGSAGDITDITGNGNDGTSSGGPTSVSGQVGNALSFDNIDDAVTIPDANSLDPATLTASCWFRPNAAASFYHTIFGKVNSSWTSGWGFVRHVDGVHYVEFFVNAYSGINSGASSVRVSDATYLPPNAWTHLCGTYDGSTISLYVNGVLVGTTSYGTGLTATANSLTCGKLGGLSPLDGRLDEPLVSSSLLSADEIAYTYQNINNNASTVTIGSWSPVVGGPAPVLCDLAHRPSFQPVLAM